MLATPERWGDRVRHVHFKVIRPQIVRDVRENDRSVLDAVIAGDTVAEATGDREVILVMVEGKAVIDAAGQDWGVLGDRMDVFEKTLPHCLYVPNGQDWRAVARTDCMIAVCSGPGQGAHPARRIGPEGITLTPRGEGTNQRFINNIAMEAEDCCDSLLVTEVFSPAGHWSSFPSHRHDEDDFPRITYLEETCFHRINPGDGFGIQRVCTDDRTLDETMAVSDGDVVCVPGGLEGGEDGGKTAQGGAAFLL